MPLALCSTFSLIGAGAFMVLAVLPNGPLQRQGVRRNVDVLCAMPCLAVVLGCSLLRLPRPERRRGPAPRPRRRGANPCRRGGRAAGVRGCGLLPLRQPREGRRGSAAQGAAPYRGRARRAVLVRVGARPPGGARDARFRGHGHSHEGNGLPLSHRGCQRLRRRVVFCLRLAFYALQLAGAA